jgi:hypothetical protein
VNNFFNNHSGKIIVAVFIALIVWGIIEDITT